jgi:hypothetical protein
LQVTKKDKEGDTKVNNTEEDELGWCWFATFGLLDPNDITLDGLGSLATERELGLGFDEDSF